MAWTAKAARSTAERSEGRDARMTPSTGPATDMAESGNSGGDKRRRQKSGEMRQHKLRVASSKMAMTEEELLLVFFAFMVVLLTFPICRACTRPTLDLLESSVGARYFSIAMLYSWM